MMTRLAEMNKHKWKTLLKAMEQRNVVPVLGPELLVAQDDSGRTIPFYRAVQMRVAENLGLPYLPDESLADFFTQACTPRIHINRKNIMDELRDVLKGLESEKQPILEKLAQLRDFFPLFLTTTPDSLLENALEQAGESLSPGINKQDGWRICFFSKNFPAFWDLPSPNIQTGCCVYHLYGKADVAPADFAADEDDRLRYAHEWMRLLFSASFKIKNLRAYLQGKYLLLLGCGFENWMTRFFLYGLSEDIDFKRSDADQRSLVISDSYLADSRAQTDHALGEFLSRNNGSIYYGGEATSFVDELQTRLIEGNIRPHGPNVVRFEKGMVFISYAKEDRSRALAIKKALEAKNIPVWFDQTKLESGDDFQDKIQFNIHACSVFVPVMSATTTTCPDERWFRREWQYAEDTLVGLPETRKDEFVFPVSVDGAIPTPDIPNHLRCKHWAVAPEGDLRDADVEKLNQWVSNLNHKIGASK